MGQKLQIFNSANNCSWHRNGEGGQRQRVFCTETVMLFIPTDCLFLSNILKKRNTSIIRIHLLNILAQIGHYTPNNI